MVFITNPPVIVPLRYVRVIADITLVWYIFNADVVRAKLHARTRVDACVGHLSTRDRGIAKQSGESRFHPVLVSLPLYLFSLSLSLSPLFHVRGRNRTKSARVSQVADLATLSCRNVLTPKLA